MGTSQISTLGWYVELGGPAGEILSHRASQDDEVGDVAARAQAHLYLFQRPALEEQLRLLREQGGSHALLADALDAEDRLRRQQHDRARQGFADLTRREGPLGAWASLRETEAMERCGELELVQQRLVETRTDVDLEPHLLRPMLEARVAFRLGEVAVAAEVLDRAADRLEHAPTPLVGSFHRAWAIYLSLLGDVPRSLLHHQLALDCLRGMGDLFMLTKEHLSLGQTYLEMGELDHAEFFFLKAEESVEELDHPPLEALLSSRLGLLTLVRGDLEAARAHFENDLAICERSGSTHGQAFARRNLGKIAARLGDPRRGLELLAGSRLDFAAQADSLNEELTRLEEASAMLASRGTLAAEEVHRHLERAIGYFQQLGRPVMVAQAQGVRARLYVEEGRLELARAEMQAASRKFLQHRRPDRLFDALLSFAESLLGQGEEAEAIHHLGWAHREALHAGRPWVARTVIDRLGDISERAVMDVLGELTPPAVRASEEARPWYEQTLVESREPAVQEMLADARAVAPTEETVLLLGETGVGKEILGRFLHAHSSRADATFVAINCGAITETLLESELFGHERGAFTGADKARVGIFEAAEGGVVFLDEVGELSAHGQVTLLRFLEDRQVRPVGSTTSRPVDVRILTATNRDLAEEVRAGRFRKDLYYRLTTFPIAVPSLRERLEDLPSLASLFLAHNPHAQARRIDSIGEAATRALTAYGWPGNLRELDNALRYAAIRCKGTLLLKRDLPRTLLAPPPDPDDFPTLEEATRRHIHDALRRSNGNKVAAARLLGVHRNTLANRLRSFPGP